MDTLNHDTASASHAETEAERQARLTWEAEGIAKGRASVEAGWYVTEAEMDAWIDSLGTDHELPPPCPTRASTLIGRDQGDPGASRAALCA
jgi:predicted transcriptional regulator